MTINEDEAWERSADRVPFPNGTAWDIWSAGTCMRCVNDGMGSYTQGEPFCPLVNIAFMGRTPAEWTDLTPPLGDYECSEFSERE